MPSKVCYHHVKLYRKFFLMIGAGVATALLVFIPTIYIKIAGMLGRGGE